MSVTQPPAGAMAAELRPPKCPYCKKDMPMVVLYPYQIGLLLLPSVQCPWCAVLLHMEIIRPQPVTEDTPPEPQKSNLWKPS